MKKLVECKSVPCYLSEALARKVDELAAGLPSGCSYQRKAYSPAAVQFEPGERAEVSIITTNQPDKSNEVVIPEGVDLSTYNGTVLFQHKEGEVVGKCQWVKLNKSDESIRAKTVYYENSEGVESKWYRFIDEVWEMVKVGALPSKSIGFLPLTEKREPSADELALHPEWSACGIWDNSLLLEYSVCAVGVNNQAMVELVNSNAKSITAEVIKSMGLAFDFPEVAEPVVLVQEAPQTALEAPTVRRVRPALSLAEIIARAAREAIPVRRKAVHRKPSPDEVLTLALEALSVDPERILRLADEAFRNRGRV